MVSVACRRGIRVSSGWLFEFSRGTTEPAVPNSLRQLSCLIRLASIAHRNVSGERSDAGAVDLCTDPGAANQWGIRGA
jgi:hypothetical protein